MQNFTPVFKGTRYGYAKVSHVWGRLTTVEDLGAQPFGRQGRSGHKLRCRCECGRMTDVWLTSLRTGSTKSCGCLNQEVRQQQRGLIHGASLAGAEDSRLYTIWLDMRQRCRNPNHISYRNYGARGITIDPRWNDFVAFRDWAKANGYAPDRSIDRYPEKDGSYSPENCRWATPAEQARNRRNNHMITWREKSQCLEDWSKDPDCPVTLSTIVRRLRRGLTEQDAISLPRQSRWSPRAK